MAVPASGETSTIGRRTMFALLGGAAASTASSSAASAADAQTIKIGYIRWMERIPTISLLDRPARNDGLAGAQMALDDDNTTGSFLGQQYVITDVPVRSQDDVTAKLTGLTQDGVALVLTDVPADRVLQLAGAARGKGVTIFNVQAPEEFAAAGGLPPRRDPCGAVARHARRCIG